MWFQYVALLFIFYCMVLFLLYLLIAISNMHSQYLVAIHFG